MTSTLVDFPGPEGDRVLIPWTRKYPIKVLVAVQWPFMIEYKGHTWYNGDMGSNNGYRMSDGCPSIEYRREDSDGHEHRLFLALDGVIQEDL
jgi:hypothetical protein